MVTDFTLRGAVLQDFHGRALEPTDLTFQNGRLTRFRPGPRCANQRIYATPGFYDAHHHLLHLGLIARRCDLGGCASLAEALETLADHVRRQAGEAAVVWGERWDESRWPERRAPTREELDAVLADRPVILRRICGHRALLNSMAAEQLVARLGALGPGGEPTEAQALELGLVWPPSEGELEAALLHAQEAALGMGITRVSEMGAFRALDTYREAVRRGALKIDVNLFVAPDAIDRVLALREEGAFRGGRLRLGGAKLFTDGSIGARTAALREPYADAAHAGELLYADETLRELIARCLAVGLPAAIHAIGDRAIEQVIAQSERAAADAGVSSLAGRIRLEHAEMITEPLLDRAARLGIDLSMQPNFIAQWGGPGGLYETALGRERALHLNPLRSVWERAIALVFGSDGMPMNPAVGLMGAVTHPLESERLTPAEALQTYLGARAAPGGLWTREDWWQYGCDGAVLYGADPLELAQGDLVRAPVLGVLWGGEWLLEPPAELYRSGVIHVL